MAQSSKEVTDRENSEEVYMNKNGRGQVLQNSQNSYQSKVRASLGNTGNMNITPMYMASHILNRNCPAPQKNGSYLNEKGQLYMEESPCHQERKRCEKMMRADAEYVLDNEQLRKFDGQPIIAEYDTDAFQDQL